MAFKREKTLATAQKMVRKGNWDRAIREYLQILEHDGTDERTRLKVADLYVKQSKLPEALEHYRIVAKQYADEDFNEKAIAVYKQALRIAPEDGQLHANLGEAYFRLGRAKDALKSFSRAERTFKETDVVKHREVLARMVDLDPDNVGVRIQLSERLEKDGARDDALEGFRHAAQVLREEGRLDEYVQVAERMIFLDGSQYELRKEVVRIYLGRGDAKRALKHLQVCFKNLPQDIETLELLGTTFHRLGNKERALLVYVELADVYKSKGQTQREMDAYRTILSFDPKNAKALNAINASKPPTPSVQIATPPPKPAEPEVYFLDEDDDALDGVLFLDDDETIGGLEEPTAASKATDFLAFAEDAMKDFADLDLSAIDEIPTRRESGTYPVVSAENSPLPEAPNTDSLKEPSQVDADVEKLEQYLTESEVFLKYGLLDRADDVISKVLKIDPNHLIGREQMRKLREKQDDPRGASHQLVEIARIHMSEGRRSDASDALQHAAKLTGDPNLVKSMAGSVGLEFSQDGTIELVDVSNSFIRKVSSGLDEISSSMFDIEIDVDPAVTGSSEIQPEVTREDLAVPGHLNEKTEDLDLDFIDGGIEIDSVAFDDEDLISLEKSEQSFTINSEAADDMFDSLFGGSSVAVMSEVDFYLEQGLVSEAEDALAKVEAQTPNHPGIGERRGQIDVFRGGASPFGKQSLTSAFRSIASQVTETGPDEFQNTHMELGHTYYEMGLFGEALEEFRHAIEDESVAGLAQFHIALCQIQLGHVDEAKNKLRELMNDQSAPAPVRLSAGEKLAEI